MVKPVFRRKSIGTKVSEEEYAKLEALAGGRALGEWVREVLLREVDGRRTDEILLAEVLALRTILLNAFYKLAQGEKLTGDEMQAIIDRADAAKLPKAVEANGQFTAGAVVTGVVNQVYVLTNSDTSAIFNTEVIGGGVDDTNEIPAWNALGVAAYRWDSGNILFYDPFNAGQFRYGCVLVGPAWQGGWSNPMPQC